MTKQPTIRVLVAEPNPLIVAGLREMIERDGHFLLVGCVQSGAALLELAGEPDFDVALIGWKLTDMDAPEILAILREQGRKLRITIFSNDQDVALVKQAVRLGAQGFCLQFDDSAILFETLRAVAHGRICIPFIDVSKINDTPLSQLTVRERELLGVLADGWTNLQIAARTGISENTVKYHLKNLYAKLDVRNRAMAVALYSSERRLNSSPPVRSGRCAPPGMRALSTHQGVAGLGRKIGNRSDV
ncbi:LuxR C-terminal-related transcriptional regulator [Bradyrhizobium genosp. P]|uniref:LuxR C-terminal-related transcriptional regulator n=1 Tax=Bradyrhizobium genosp. P TaxID=83641 RepID=UPI003CEF4E3A